MRFIPPTVHGVFDYLFATLLIISPSLFGFADDTAATHLPVSVGTGGFIYSLLTDYEPSVIRLIPFPIHLNLDFALGLILIISPWLSGFAERVAAPHIILGVLASLLAIMTSHDGDGTKTEQQQS